MFFFFVQYEDVISDYFNDTECSEWSILGSLKYIFENSTVYPENFQSTIKDLKSFVTSLSRNVNLACNAKKSQVHVRQL